MPKTTTNQRQRRARAFASFVEHPLIDGKHRDFCGNPEHAPKRWKRLWARQAKYVRAWRQKAKAARRAAAQKEA